MSPQEAFGVALILIALAVPVIVIGVVYYLKKRFEHKQIMAAIEKGMSLSEIMPTKPKLAGPNWIKYITAGVTIFVIGLAFMVAGPGAGGLALFIALILCGVGLASIIRGLLYRKYQPQNQPLAKSNAAKNKNTLGVSASETSK